MTIDHADAFRAFQKVTTCLNENFGEKYFIIDGTLLGFERSGGFIPNDTDIDFGMWIDDFDERIFEDFSKAGIKFLKSLGTVAHGYQLKFLCGDIPIDIVFYYREENHVWNIVYPKWAVFKATLPMFDLAPVNFKGIDVMAPNPPELYLSTVYGPEWRRIVYRWNYKYLTHNIEVVSGKLSKIWHRIQGNHWRKKNPDIYERKDGSHAVNVFTDGVFDLFHANHALTLQEARSYGDRLVVGVVSDALAKAYKRQPVIPEQERLRIVQSIDVVDQAFILNGEWDAANMERIISDYDIGQVVYAGDSLVGFEDYFNVAIDKGIFHHMDYHSGPSTSQIIERVKNR